MSICPKCKVVDELIRCPVHVCNVCRVGLTDKQIKELEENYYSKPSKKTTTFPYKLCYVDAHFAYFTTKPLKEQNGDGWDKKHYEHNSGEPYLPVVSSTMSLETFLKRKDKYCRKVKDYLSTWSGKEYAMVEVTEFDEKGEPLWRIVKIAFDGKFDTPKEGHLNSPYSVEDINKGNVAWLISWDKEVGIFAGCSIPDFIEKIINGGGQIYLPFGEDL